MIVRSRRRARPRLLLDESRRTRAMIWIMAIMVFLTTLAAAFGLGTFSAANALDRQLSARLTIQIVEADATARDAHAAELVRRLRADPGVRQVAEVDRAELAGLLKPWLGDAGLDPDLPMPAMIDLDLGDTGEAAIARVERAARAVAPGRVRVDLHARWLAPVRGFVAMLGWLAGGLVLLMVGATGAVVLLSARAGLDTHRDTIEVLHMLGSTDVQVARLFQRRVALETLVGGVAGTLAAVLLTVFLQARLAMLGSELLGAAVLTQRDWMLLGLLPLLFVGLATLAARAGVLRALGKTL